MKRLKLIWLLLVLIAFVTLSACQSKNGADVPASPYKVIDTGLWSYDVLTLPLWLDNDRLMFASTDSLTPDNAAMHLKVLNTQTGQVASTPFYTAFCVRNGIALFQQKDELTGKTIDYRGTPENYRQEPMPSDDMRFDMNFDCDWVPKQPYEIAPDGYARKFKLRGGNYGEIIEPATAVYEFMKRPRDRRQEQESGIKGNVGKSLYHQNENSPGTLIPPATAPGGIRYTEFLDAYVVSTNHYDPKYPETSSFSILHRNGELETIPYPKTMLPGNNDIYPVKNGFLVHYNDGPASETDSGKRGLHLIKDGKVYSLIIGVFGHVVVSPNGCKAAIADAFTVNEDLMKASKRTIKFINVCQEDSQS